MNLNNKIEPHVGLSPLKFGMTQQQVKELLGEPNLIENQNYIKDLTSVIYIYNDYGLEVSFSSDDDFLLSTIRIENMGYEFAGIEWIGLTEQQFLNLKNANDLEDVVLDAEVSDEFNKVYFSDKHSMIISFNDEELTDISYFCQYNDEGNPVWPVTE